MKTVSELAKELNVTPQAIYKRLNKTLKTELKRHVQTDESGKKVITSDGVALIKRSFEQDLNAFKTDSKQEQPEIIEHMKQEIEYLRKQLSQKDELIAKKDEQIQEQLREASKLHQNTQEILLRVNSKPLIEEAIERKETSNKVGLFKRLFDKERG